MIDLKKNLIILFIFLMVLVPVVGAIEISEGINTLGNTEVNLTPTEVSFKYLKNGITASSSIKIDGEQFIAPVVKTSEKSLTMESESLSEELPVISTLYEYNETTLKETITLQEDRELSFPLKLDIDSKIIPSNDGDWLVVKKDGSDLTNAITLLRPWGIDANGNKVDMYYELIDNTLYLRYERVAKQYNESLTNELNVKDRINKNKLVKQYDNVNITYPLVIDPTWQVVANWDARYGHTGVIIPNGSIVLMGGFGDNFYNDTWISTTNGTNWVRVNASSGWDARYGHTSVITSNGSIVLMGGTDNTLNFNDTWISTTNGTNWVRVNVSSGWDARAHHSTIITSNGSIVLMGGGTNDLSVNDTWISTTNGTNWVRVNASGGWEVRNSHTSVITPNGSIVLMGGFGDNFYNDTWISTTNGTNWVRVNASGGWGTRAGHTSVITPNGSIVLMGGTDFFSSITYNDTWISTTNGTNWVRVNASGGWEKRMFLSSNFLPDNVIVIFGGADQMIEPPKVYNDSWWSSNYGKTWKQAPPPTFTSNVTTGTANLPVLFNETSYNIGTSWQWNATNVSFNTTPITFSTSQNATFSFPVGNWSIRLNSTNAGGSDYSAQTTFINVSAAASVYTPQPCIGGGTYNSFTAYNNYFISNNTNCTVILWNTTGSKTWSTYNNITSNNSLSYLILAGGGGGGKVLGGGGGGAGGFTEGIYSNNLTGSLTIVVGAGGAASTTTNIPGVSGGNSSFGNLTSNITMYGGSGGGSRNDTNMKNSNVRVGASTGGGGSPSAAGYMLSNFSNQEGYGRGGGRGLYTSSTSYSGGGGGSYLQNGTDSSATRIKAGDGGGAINTTFAGFNMTLAGGGGGGTYNSTQAARGLGGANGTTVGGYGAYRTTAAVAAVVKTGSGGGGGGSTGIGSAGSDGIVMIKYTTEIPNASFTSNISGGVEPLVVQFNDTSGFRPTSWLWGARNVTGNNTWFTFDTVQNPIETFPVGNWSINLTATNSGGVNTSTQLTFINVSKVSSVPIIPNFTSNVTSGVQTMYVQFNDTSFIYNPTMWNWSFGDNSWSNQTSASLANVTEVYSTGGTYTVNLSITNASGTNTTSKTAYITVYNTTVSTWTSNVTSGIVPFTVLFNDTAPNLNATTWNWTSDDGLYSSLRNTTLTYTVVGSHSVNHSANNTAYISWTNQSNYITAYAKPVISFVANTTTGKIPPSVPIQFNDTSGIKTPTMWNYSLGDGTWYNSTVSGNFTDYYSNYGRYTVGLNVSNASFSNWSQYINYITITNQSPIVNFTSNVTSGMFSLPVQFNITGSISNNTQYVNWSFGDNSWSNQSSASLFNVSKIYSTGGTYSVSLYMTNDGGTNSTTKTNFITVNNHTSITDFTGSNTSGESGLVVRFTQTSFNASTYNWSFGDGTYSDVDNPLKIYNTPGTYSVNFSVNNTADQTWLNKSNYIVVTSLTIPVVSNYIMNSSTGLYPLTVQFNDTSSNTPTNWNWSFGDGSYSATQNPVKVFITGGNFTVILNATNSNTSVYNPKTNYTQVYNQTIANFQSNVTSGLYNLGVQFNTTSTNATWWNWSFGDGTWNNQTSLSGSNITKLYTTGGNYTITLNTSNNGYGYSTKTGYIEVFNHTSITDFTGSNTTGDAALVVRFTQTSYNGSTYNWSFGDGTFSTLQNPLKIFSTPGLYSINLSINNTADQTWLNKSNYINVTTATMASVSNFNMNKSSGLYPLAVQFTDGSTNTPTNWNWSFGDGSYSATQNPVKVFSTGGNYSIVLNATNSNTSFFYSKTNYTEVFNYTVSGFSANRTNGISPAVIKFTRTISSDNASWRNWSFGDGSWDNTTSDPTHTYTTLGTFTVSETTYNLYATNTTTLTNYITISNLATVSSFTMNKSKATQPADILFTDTTTNTPTAWSWSFGDGTFAFTQNPVHTFNIFGVYTIYLNTSNSNTSVYYPQTQYLNITENIISDFSVNTTTGVQSQGVVFTDLSNNATVWLWNFGDGTTSTLKNPTHTYSNYGTFTVSLNASTDTDYDIKTKVGYITIKEKMITDFSSDVTSGLSPLTVHFSDASNNATSWTWNFGDATSSNLQNPTKIYVGAGVYTVSLTTGNVYGLSNSTTKINYISISTAPTASFTATPVFGTSPLSVTFTDTSIGVPTSWNWSFGDGTYSNLQNPPVHVYTSGLPVKDYFVTLTAANAFGATTSAPVNIRIAYSNTPQLMPTLSFNGSVNLDIGNGTFTGPLFGNMLQTGKLNIWDIVSGTFAPFTKQFEKTDGGAYVFILMLWLIYLGFLYIQMNNVGMVLISGIGTASVAAYCIPSYAFPIMTTLFAACMAMIFYKLFIDSR